MGFNHSGTCEENRSQVSTTKFKNLLSIPYTSRAALDGGWDSLADIARTIQGTQLRAV